MKHCIECGCLMSDYHESDVCEVCNEEMGGQRSEMARAAEDEDSLYLSVEWPKVNPFLSRDRESDNL